MMQSVRLVSKICSSLPQLVFSRFQLGSFGTVNSLHNNLSLHGSYINSLPAISQPFRSFHSGKIQHYYNPPASGTFRTSLLFASWLFSMTRIDAKLQRLTSR